MKRGIAVWLAIVSIFALTTTGMAAGLEGYVMASILHVREQPFSESSAIHQIRLGEKVTILSKENEWYQVACANGAVGYAYAQFISIGGTGSASDSNKSAASGAAVASGSKSSTSSTAAQTGSGSKATTVSSASMPSLTRIGDRGGFVSIIQQALYDDGYYTSTVDGIFGQLTLQAVRNFQKNNGLVVDGIVGKATIQAMFGDTTTYSQDAGTSTQASAKSATSVQSQSTQVWDNATTDTQSQTTVASSSSNSKTKSLDWFSEGYRLISNNRDITIYDLNTGVVWKARYINGKNHADIIPASSSDAKKITSSNIVGSYVRRPVIVTIAGSDYAGSMYAVGHGEDNYCDYFKGVMCIHFTGSQTHGTQKVDADHQKAIEVALKATVNR